MSDMEKLAKIFNGVDDMDIFPEDNTVSEGSPEGAEHPCTTLAEVVDLQQKKLGLNGEDLALAQFADHFVSIEGGKAFIYREIKEPGGRVELQRMSVKAFHELHATKRVTTAKGVQATSRVWFSSPGRRTYTGGLELLPGENAPDGVYNLWSGFGCEPDQTATARDIRLALWHLKYVICGGDQVAYRYLLCWLASCVQNPGRQAEVAVVMIGGRGTGKGTVGGWLMDLFGQHGLPIQSADHLTGRFNGHLKSGAALFVDEAFFAGDHKGNNKLKSLITEDTLLLEDKHVSAFTVKNRLKIMMATNADHAIPAGIDERRFFVTQVSDRVKQNHDYFAELRCWWQSGGNRAFLALLQRIDLSSFNIRRVPQTKALGQQKLESLHGLDEWLYELLQGSESDWKTDRTAEELAQLFRFFCQEKGYRYEKTSPKAVGKGIRKWLNVERKRGKPPKREWFLALPELDEARRQFAEKINVDIDWDV
ncbi:hypothetical protein C6W92_17115 [Roseovarius sp. A46]|uniref:DUF5906 domain-containing protein n=1 Tax=Roseovarius sp. A46 TaxID=2109331 RepID=UPI001012BB14|nr:DUF5906 domain-containing protein [Roseovarius sp. A46]RXV58075.1 hypothetical protein C6W92_17115 [Roseovarius sp. A46]